MCVVHVLQSATGSDVFGALVRPSSVWVGISPDNKTYRMVFENIYDNVILQCDTPRSGRVSIAILDEPT
jgi:hypothetical protein